MKQKSPSKPNQRFDTIDLLRGISVLSVIYWHITIFLFYSFVPNAIPVWLQKQYGDRCWFGVPCFFAISGFLITYTSIQRFGSLSAIVPSAFYRIRFARIAPPLLLLLAVLSCLHMANVAPFHIDPKVSTLPRALFAVLTFQFNRLTAAPGLFPGPWIPLWSLSVEEMFYLCFPLLCAALLRRRWGMPVFLALLAGFVAIGPIARKDLYASNPMWAYHSYLSTMDNIALGCLFGLLAVSIKKHSASVHSACILLLKLTGVFLILLALGPAWVISPPIFSIQRVLWQTSISFNVLGVGTCLIMLATVLKPSPGWLLTAPLRWMGRYSYEVYLTNSFVGFGLSTLFFRVYKGSISLEAVATILLSGLLGYLISRYFSEPMNRLLRGAPLPSQLTSA
jgi:peptidoglycan/LPS O-acetylase OafA/YrhL